MQLTYCKLNTQLCAVPGKLRGEALTQILSRVFELARMIGVPQSEDIPEIPIDIKSLLY
ncbi:MAG: hypothetical protein GDA45_03650 [Chromatiales bacterium]|nr:hypothetical protein [Chromatiales bacterium]